MTSCWCGGDADAGVAHRERDAAVAGRRDTRSDDLAALGELERVRQQVLQDLPEPLRVGLDRARARPASTSTSKREPLLAARAARRSGQAVDEPRERRPAPAATSTLPASIFDRSRMSLISASRSLPADEMVCANLTCSAVRLPSWLSASSLARISERVERRAQLVAHVGQELALVLVGALELVGLARSSVACARRSSSFCCSSSCVCSSSCALVCSSSACWVSSRACDSLQRAALLLELLVGDAQLLLLGLQLLGLALRLLEQLLEPAVLRRAHRDAERFGDAGEQLLLRSAEPPEESELDDGMHDAVDAPGATSSSDGFPRPRLEATGR